MKKHITIIMTIVITFSLITSCNNTPPKTNLQAVSNGDIVYYVVKGKSYHSTKGCPSLARSSNIKQAILDTTRNYPKKDPCNNCVNQK